MPGIGITEAALGSPAFLIGFSDGICHIELEWNPFCDTPDGLRQRICSRRIVSEGLKE
jgi:hypothetical protein